MTVGAFDPTRVVIAHHLDDMILAHQAAAQAGAPLVLQSPAGGLYYARAAFWLGCFSQAQASQREVESHYIIDASDAGVEALDALAQGCRYLRSDATTEIREKIISVANQYNVSMVAGSYTSFDLAHCKNPLSDCMAWLNGK